MKLYKYIINCFLFLWLMMPLITWAQAPGHEHFVTHNDEGGFFPLSVDGTVCPILTDKDDWHGLQHAVGSLAADLKAVVGNTPDIINDLPTNKPLIIAGTLGKSKWIDGLVKGGKLDTNGFTGKWETYIIQTVSNPYPGIDKALVIAGSDKRGSIYGVYEISLQIGVSPWYWWADVPIKTQQALFVKPGRYTDGSPAIKYRGIFLNDEAPALKGWSKEKFGGMNHKVYEKIFELLLRLKANYLWPAMWDNAFNDDDKLNPILADEYGIVMGTSHHEPMDRAQQEWKRYGSGQWNYETNKTVLQQFWRKGIENMGTKETLVTIGMRGDGDMPMMEGSNIALLERIVQDQREIIGDVLKRDPANVPQVWALYKEVQDYYDKGMQVPDDVTLLLCDDNWGNIRRLPLLTDKPRKGGYGIYYHFDYVGDPRNYKWLNTNTIAKTWEQMHLAYVYQARQIWIVNVGDLKPMEYPISFFLDYAWNPERWPASSLDDYAKEWAAQQFGPDHASAIANLLTSYSTYNARRKPEQLSVSTYNLDSYNEYERVVNDYTTLSAKADSVFKLIPANYRDAYWQLVKHPIDACANLNAMYLNAALNQRYAAQGRAATNVMADSVRLKFDKDAAISKYYNKTLSNGKWNHMMDQAHIGYKSWNDPKSNIMPETKTLALPSNGRIGVAIEGMPQSWPQSNATLILPAFNEWQPNEKHYIEIFNTGLSKVSFKLKTDAWVKATVNSAQIDLQQRVWLQVDWDNVPAGLAETQVELIGNHGESVLIYLPLSRLHQDIKNAFVQNNGYIAIEAEHFTKAVNTDKIQWTIIPHYGRTVSGVTPMPSSAEPQIPTGNNPHLEYNVFLTEAGSIKINAYLSPSINFLHSKSFSVAISIDDAPAKIIDANSDLTTPYWRNVVSNNCNIVSANFYIKNKGLHIVKYWMLSPGIVLEKLVLDVNHQLKPSYLGPPESVFLPIEQSSAAK